MLAFVRLLAMCSVVLALAASTPVVCWCNPAEHQNQLLHPLFAHSHHAPADVDDAAEATPIAPSWSATTAYGSFAWADGTQVLVPPTLAILLLVAGGVLLPNALRPLEYARPPTSPPPR